MTNITTSGLSCNCDTVLHTGRCFEYLEKYLAIPETVSFPEGLTTLHSNVKKLVVSTSLAKPIVIGRDYRFRQKKRPYFRLVIDKYSKYIRYYVYGLSPLTMYRQNTPTPADIITYRYNAMLVYVKPAEDYQASSIMVFLVSH